MKSFEKLVVIDGYQFRITFFAKETSRLGRWLIDEVVVKDNEKNKVVYRGNPFFGSAQTLKGAFEESARAARKRLLRSKEINNDIKELESWDGVINFN
ncbi:hypothetical protein RY279_18570 [Bacillus velezensis]|uniref:hypothetical protein n=1 Tax=Bacillus amyloliquefaciens group TaxID=1938374 RepID=UPI001ABE5DA7|nr:hypothetical protein [Bacillus amyloliquefaciens]QTG83426.1 hypothetical protein J4048_10600 [Bacillus amyloliquefaciens]